MRDKDRERVQKACEDMGSCGERVLGFAIASLPFTEFPREFVFRDTANKDEITFNFPMVLSWPLPSQGFLHTSRMISRLSVCSLSWTHLVLPCLAPFNVSMRLASAW